VDDEGPRGLWRWWRLGIVVLAGDDDGDSLVEMRGSSVSSNA